MPITVTAPGVNWLEELTVESQPPDWLGWYQLYVADALKDAGGENMVIWGVLQRLKGCDNVWPSSRSIRLDVHEEVYGLRPGRVEDSIVSGGCGEGRICGILAAQRI